MCFGRRSGPDPAIAAEQKKQEEEAAEQKKIADREAAEAKAKALLCLSL
jgi:hypothetical protein